MAIEIIKVEHSQDGEQWSIAQTVEREAGAPIAVTYNGSARFVRLNPIAARVTLALGVAARTQVRSDDD